MKKLKFISVSLAVFLILSVGVLSDVIGLDCLNLTTIEAQAATTKFPEKMLEEIVNNYKTLEGSYYRTDISKYNIPLSDVDDLQTAILEYDPILGTFLSGYFSYSYSYGSSDKSTLSSISLESCDEDELAEQYVRLKAVLDYFKTATQGMSDFQKILYLHDYLVINNDYDYTFSKFSAYDALVHESSVCQGYADAFTLSMNYLGIDCMTISSWEMNHAWNIVKLGSKWYHMDITFDDPTYMTIGTGINGNSNYDHFLLNDSQMLEADHEGWYSPYKCDSNLYVKMPRTDNGQQYYYNGLWYFYGSSQTYGSGLYSVDQYGVGVKYINDLYNDGLAICGEYVIYGEGRDIFLQSMNNSSVKAKLYTAPTKDLNFQYYTTLINNNKNILQYYYSNGSYENRFNGTNLIDLKTKAVHTHSYETSYSAFDCSKGVFQIYTCSCGHLAYKTLAAKGHVYSSWVITKKPTLTQFGTKMRKCEACGKVETASVERLKLAVSTPTITNYSKNVSAVKLYWDKATNATGYRVYVRVGTTWKRFKDLFGKDITSYYIDGLSPNASYKFCIKAFAKNLDGTYSWSSPSAICIATTAATKTELKKTAVSCESVKLNWTKTLGATGYVVKQKVGDSWKVIKVLSNAYDYYYISNLKSNTIYELYVTAYVKSGSGKVSYLTGDFDTVKTLSTQVKINTTYANTTNAIKIYWDKVSVASGYRVYCYDNGKFISAQNITTNSYYKGNLKTGSKYQFIVKAYKINSNKTITWYENSSVKTTMTDLAQGKITAVATNESAVKIAWSKVPNASGYRVYMKVNGKWSIVKNIFDANASSYYIDGLNSNTKYEFRIAPFSIATSPIVWGGVSASRFAATK